VNNGLQTPKRVSAAATSQQKTKSAAAAASAKRLALLSTGAMTMGYGYGYWGMMDGWGYGYGYGLAHMVIWFVILAAIIIGIVWLVRSLSANDARVLQRRPAGLDVLEERYARGEIKRDEYLEKKRDLNS
jgi:putative membrane protein